MTWNLISNPFFIATDFPESDLLLILLLFIGAFYLTLLLMRLIGMMRKRTCPSCSGKLSRKERNLFDRILVALTLSILPFRRYRCIHCGWEGLRWSNKKGRSKESY